MSAVFQTASLANVQVEKWDVIICGSSFASMLFLHGLPDGLKILVIEAGGFIPWQEQIDERSRPTQGFAIENTSGKDKFFVAHRMFGGNSNCWWGQTPRFHPNDFRLGSLYGVAQDWPIQYADLEPFYADVEDIMQIAGGGSSHILPRSRPFPFAPHAPSRTDEVLLRERSDIWVPVPTARANGGDRAACCANGICEFCPIHSKYTILNDVNRFAKHNVTLLLQTEVREVVTNAGAAKGVVVVSDGQSAEIEGDMVALGTNGINNAAIMLRSSVGGPMVGRFLHEQIAVHVDVDIDHPNYFGGTSITAHCYGAYDGDHRSDTAGALIENYNAPNALRMEKGRWTERMRLKVIAENIPKEENRVGLGQNDKPLVYWGGNSDYSKRGIERAIGMIPDLLPFNVENIEVLEEETTEAHIQGTHRMGTDPLTSVVDDGLKVHGTAGLLALGAGSFPTCSPSNPTLTLSALSLRAGRMM